MARRRGSTRSYEDGQRDSIGSSYVDEACTALNQACLKEAAMFVPGLTVREVIPMLFPDDVVDRLKAVHGLLALEDTSHSYNLQPHASATITLVTRDIMPTPNLAALYWHEDRVGPLVSALHTLNDLHVKWGAVKHLLRWFNKNATPGAVRANWPSVMQLCRDAPALKELHHSPTRYTNPQELSALLPLIRGTATTVASMAMLPGAAHPRPRGTVSITLPEGKAICEGVVINLDKQDFYL